MPGLIRLGHRTSALDAAHVAALRFCGFRVHFSGMQCFPEKRVCLAASSVIGSETQALATITGSALVLRENHWDLIVSESQKIPTKLISVF